MRPMVARTWASTWWAPASGPRCRICQTAEDRLGPISSACARGLALRLLAGRDPRELARTTVEALSGRIPADVLFLVPGATDAWHVLASSRPGVADDLLLEGERWPELAAARRDATPILPVAAEGDRPEPPLSVAVLPVFCPPGTREAAVLVVDSRESPEIETVALAVLAAHLLLHRLETGDGAHTAQRLGFGDASQQPGAPGWLHAKVGELEAANRRLEELARLRTRFVSDAAHELKTPLAILRSYLEALTTDLVGGLDRQQREFLAAAAEGARRLQRLVEELLDLAALESGNLPLSIGAVDAPSAIRAAFEELLPLARLGEVEVRLGPLESATARADPARLAQVLRNLLDNALKYTPPAGRVRLSCRRRGDAVVLEVTDTGVGIPADELPRIFDEFYRVRRAPQGEGAGLGLAIVRRLVLAMGGRIDVTSQTGSGSRFSVELPAWTGGP